MVETITEKILSIPADGECKSLEEVRTQIDAIDAKIIRLISQRSKYVSQAGTFKQSTTEMVASDRVQRVINKIRFLSEKESLDADIAEKIYRTIIRSFTQKEIESSISIYKTIKQSYY